jgi:thioredoxin-related protein
MRRWFGFILLLFPFLVSAEALDPGKHFFHPKLGDFKEELVVAKEEGKKGIMLFFEMDDCPFCARMKSTILSQRDVQNFFREHFLLYPIDTQGDTPMVDFSGKESIEKAFALEHRVRATPTIVFFDLDGKAIVRHTGPTKDKDEFLLLGRYVIEGAYKQGPFARFKQGQNTAR